MANIRIPVFDERVVRPPFNPERAVLNVPPVDTNLAEGIGPAIQDIGQELQRVAAIEEKSRAQRQLLEIDEGARLQIQEIRSNASLDGEGRLRAFDDFFSGERSKREGQFSNLEISAGFQGDLDAMRMKHRQTIQDFTYKDNQAKAEAAIDESLDMLGRLAMEDLDGSIRQMEEIVIQQGLDAGWDANQVGDKVRSYTGLYTANYIRRGFLVDPYAVQAQLLDASQFEGLDEKSRTTLLTQADRLVEQADREQISNLERAERLADKAERKRQSVNAARFRARMMQGPPLNSSELTHALEAGDLTLDQHELLLRASRFEEEGVDVPDIAIRLQRDVLEGLIDDSDILRARAEGSLSKTTTNQLIRTYEQFTQQGGVLQREDVKNARRLLDGAVKPMGGPLAAFDREDIDRWQFATDEFIQEVQNDYAKSLVEKRPFDPRAVAERLAKLYRADVVKIESLRLPDIPGVEVLTRQNLDIPMLRQLIKEKYDSGDMSDEQVVRETKLLKRYQEILDRQKAK